MLLKPATQVAPPALQLGSAAQQLAVVAGPTHTCPSSPCRRFFGTLITPEEDQARRENNRRIAAEKMQQAAQ